VRIGLRSGSPTRWASIVTDEHVVPPPGGALSDDELRQMVMLLARYATFDLDQWESWQIATEYGPVFVMLTNSLPVGADAEGFHTIWPLPDRLQPTARDSAP